MPPVCRTGQSIVAQALVVSRQGRGRAGGVEILDAVSDASASRPVRSAPILRIRGVEKLDGRCCGFRRSQRQPEPGRERRRWVVALLLMSDQFDNVST
jgi:hypothetical protein